MGCIWAVNMLRKTLRSSNPGNPEDAWQQELDCQILALHHLVQDHECTATGGPHTSSAHRRGVVQACLTTMNLRALAGQLLL